MKTFFFYNCEYVLGTRRKVHLKLDFMYFKLQEQAILLIHRMCVGNFPEVKVVTGENYTSSGETSYLLR